MAIESRYPKGEIVFAHWKVEKHLGGGSNGKTAVFVLSHTNSEKIHSALKVVNLITEEGSPEECTPFQREEYQAAAESCTQAAIGEVLLMSGLQGQPNIVAYLDHAVADWQEDGCFGRDLLIRMELLTDLRKLMLRGKVFSEEEVVRIGSDICTALSVCHQKNILHRDIKPENIFVNDDGVYKLGDFGISRILDSASDSRASTCVGTPQYAAPEQFALEYDKRADLYSLGLVLYELRNGNRLPFTDARASMPEFVRRRLSGEAFPELKSTSPELSAAIFRACRFQPEERFPTAEAFARALPGAGGSARPEPPKNAEKKNDFRSLRKLLLPGLVAILTVALAISMGTRRAPAPVTETTDPAALQSLPAETDPSQPVTEAAVIPVDTSVFATEVLKDGTLSITGSDGSLPAELILPGEIDGKPVTVIGRGAFAEQDIRRVVIPEGVATIEANAFVECKNLESVVFPSTLRVIEFSVFVGCEKLGDVRLPNGLTAVGENAFNYTGITSIFIPASVESMEDVFLACNKLTSIEVSADNPCYSSENGILFNKDKTKLIRCPSNCPLENYSVPEGVKTLGRYAFEGVALYTIKLPEGLLSIEDDCFYMAENLVGLTLPASTVYVADGVTGSCRKLESIQVAEGNTKYTSVDGVLCSADKKTIIAFPPARTGAYSIPDTVTQLGRKAFYGSRLTQITVPAGISSIPERCFGCCYQLSDIRLTEGLTQIQSCAFATCISLNSIRIPKSVSFIGRYAFNWNDELHHAEILNPNCTIEEAAFPEGCRIVK